MKLLDLNTNFEVNSLGLVQQKQHPLIWVRPKLRPALHKLDLFSHLLLIWRADEQQNQAVNPFGLSVCRLSMLDEKKGLLVVDALDAPDGAQVLDIKPYFPIEDRAHLPEVPAQFANLPEWRPEQNGEQNRPAAAAMEDELLTPHIPATKFDLQPLGWVRNDQSSWWLDVPKMDIAELQKLQGFSHLRVFMYFDRFDNKRMRQATQCNPPYENAPRHGIWATRSPVRPNPIGLTTVRILQIQPENKRLLVSLLDVFDGTPVLGLKPYIPAYDRVEEAIVPRWVRHWPEWIEEEQTQPVKGGVPLQPGERERLSAFQTNDIAPPTPPISPEAASDQPDLLEAQENFILVRGARQNNLKNIQVQIPRRKMTVVTGVSGSGKSSLAFDTLYAESQRRFMGSLSTFGRMSFEQIEKPQVDQVLGLQMAVAVEQKAISRNPRSTVGTITEVYDYLRLMYARIGVRHCPQCGRTVTPQTPDEICHDLLQLAPGLDLQIANRKTGQVIASFETPQNAHNQSHYVQELKAAVQQALQEGDGALIVRLGEEEEFLLSQRNSCFHCDQHFFQLFASSFSFNNPHGMCPECGGIGKKLVVDPQRVVADPQRSIMDGASAWWGNLREYAKKPTANWLRNELLALAQDWQVDLELPWCELPEGFRREALYGNNGKAVTFEYNSVKSGRRGEIKRPAEGAVNNIQRLFKDSTGKVTQAFYLQFMNDEPCPVCQGERLSPEARMVSVAGIRYPQAALMTINALYDWVIALPQQLNQLENQLMAESLEELQARLSALKEVGLGYLTLERPVPTLSGGEAQRIRLAAQLNCGLTGLLYVLDEPSIGLHAHDHQRLLSTMRQLCEQGNTLVVVEHDASAMRAADYLIDLGPGAGTAGGEIVAEGTPEMVMKNPASLTGQYLSGAKAMQTNGKHKKSPSTWLTIRGACLHNLQDIDVSIPLGVLTCISGVSGSGKSSLISQTLYPALKNHLKQAGTEDETEISVQAGPFEQIEGLGQIQKVINISQTPIGRTPRSNPATYSGVFDEIRKLFAKSETAKARGYSATRFSFNSGSGRCQACEGDGRKRYEMHFMPDVWITCPECLGRRFNPETLEITWKDKSIADVLEMDIAEALELFAGEKRITRILQTLYDVGLGYLKLGQSALTLSGGEAQRVKLAKELSRSDNGHTLYLLDEPTTGLHFADIEKLMEILHRLTAAGHSVMVIEHDLDVIRSADWVIDLGPGGGDAGGEVVIAGTPQEVAACPESVTGKYLHELIPLP